MSEPEREEVTVSGEGVAVRKSVDTDQFETLALVFDIESRRDDQATLLLTDTVPEEIPMDDVGFHPEYGSEHWTVDGGEVTFQRTFDAGEEYTTIYGIRDYDTAAIAELLIPPAVEIVEDTLAGTATEGEPAPVDEIAPPERSEVVRDAIAGDPDGVTGGSSPDDAAAINPPEADPPEAAAADTPDEPTETEADDEPIPSEADDEPTPTAAGDEPTEATMEDEATEIEADGATAAVIEAAGDGAEAPPEVDQIRVPVTGGVARVLAKELREGTVEEEDRRLLREELSAGEASTDARIKHLQNEVSDFTAYTGALESFLDENGTAQQLLDDLADRMGSLEGELVALDDEVARVESRAVTGDDLRDLESTVAGVEADVEDVRAELDRLDELDRRAETLDDAVAELRRDVENLADLRERLSSVFGPDE